ncbi:MAG: hypothetical protein V8Q42_03810 [Anaerovoracaceae bacterium]
MLANSGRGNILNSIAAVYGNDTAKDLLPVDSGGDGYIIRGSYPRHQIQLSSRADRMLLRERKGGFSKVLEKAPDEVYREKMFQGRFPLAFLFLAMRRRSWM